jgi:hypothetical protein
MKYCEQLCERSFRNTAIEEKVQPTVFPGTEPRGAIGSHGSLDFEEIKKNTKDMGPRRL